MSSPIQRVLALCDRWDSLTHGESSTTRQIRAEAQPQPGDILPVLFPKLSEEELEEIKERLQHPARIFVLPKDDSFDFEIIDTDQLELTWGDEPCE